MKVNGSIACVLLLLFLGSISAFPQSPHLTTDSPPLRESASHHQQTLPIANPNPQQLIPPTSGVDIFSGSSAPLSGTITAGCTTPTTNRYMTEASSLEVIGPQVDPPTEGTYFDYFFTSYVGDLWGQRSEWLSDYHFDHGTPWTNHTDGIAQISFASEEGISYGEIESPLLIGWIIYQGTCQGYFSQSFLVPPGWFSDTRGLFPLHRTQLTLGFRYKNWVRICAQIYVDSVLAATPYDMDLASPLDTWVTDEVNLHFDSALPDHAATIELRLNVWVTTASTLFSSHWSAVRFDYANLWALHKLRSSDLDLALRSEADPTKQYAVSNGVDWGKGHVSVLDTCASGTGTSYYFTRSDSGASDWPVTVFNHHESMEASWERTADTTFSVISGASFADWGISFSSQVTGAQWQPGSFSLSLPCGWSNYQSSPNNPSGSVSLSEASYSIFVNNPAEGVWTFSANSVNRLATHGGWSVTADSTQTYAAVGDQFNVTVSYAAGPTFAKYRIICDGTQVYEQPSGNLYLPVNGSGDGYLTEVVAGVLEGWYDVMAFAVNPQTGEVGATTIHGIYLIDCTTPLLSFSAPANAAHVAAGKLCSLVWQQTDEGNPPAGLAASNLTITGPNNYHHRISTTDTGSQTQEWTVPTIEGTYTVNTTAVDRVGNWASLLRTLHVDATPPIVTVDFLSEGTILSQTVVVEVSADDFGINPSGVLWVVLSVDGVLLYNTTTCPPFLFPWDTQEWCDGNHTLAAIASDGVGWIATHSLIVVVDNTLPDVVIASPLEGEYYSATGLSAIWEGTDNTGIAYYQVYLDGVLLANTVDTMFLLSNLTESIHTLTVEAIDLAGNHQSTSNIFTTDATSPTLAITAPLEDSHTSSVNPRIQWSASDTTAGIATFTVYLDGTLAVELDGSYRQYTLTNLTDGSHTILVQAMDRAGNALARSVTFLIDSTAPILEVFLPVTEAGFTENTTLDVVVFVTDRHCETIELFIDGIFSGVAENTNETTFTIAVTAAPHTVLIKATDIAGNVAEYTEAFTVDLENPVVRIDTPTAGTILTGIVEITLFLADANMREAILLLDGEVVLFRLHSSGSHTLTLDTSTLPDGDHILTLIGYDLALRTCQAEQSVTLCNHPPTILTAKLSTLYGNATICDTDTLSVQVTLNATYPDDLLTLTVQLDTDGNSVPESFALSCYGSVWMTSGIIGPLQGMHSYTATVIAKSPAGASSEIIEFCVVATTQLTLSVPADLTTQQTTQITAIVTTSTGQPVAHQLIRFFLEGINGTSLLGEAYTNAEGEATLDWLVSQSLVGVVTLRAEFVGTSLLQAGEAEAKTTILNVFASLDDKQLIGSYILMNGPWIVICLAGLAFVDPKLLLFMFAGLGASLPGDISFLTFHEQLHHHAQTNLDAYAQDLLQFFQALNLSTFQVEPLTTVLGSFLLVGYRTAVDPTKHTVDAARLSLAEMLRLQALQQQLGDDLYYLGEGDLQRWCFDSNPLVEDEFLQSALQSTQLLSVEASPFATTPEYQVGEADWSRVKPYLAPTQVFEGSLSMGWFVPTFLFYGEVVVRGWDLGYESLDKYLENTILAVIHQKQVEVKVAETLAKLARLRDEVALQERIQEARDSLLSTAESMYKDAGSETWNQVGLEAQRLFDELIHYAKIRNLEEASYKLTGLLRLLKLNAGLEDRFGWQVVYDRSVQAILLFEAGYIEEPMYVIKGVAEALNRHSGKPLSLPEVVGELATQYAIKKVTDGQLSFFDPKAILGPAWDFITQCLSVLIEIGKTILMTLGMVLLQAIFGIITAVRNALTNIIFVPLEFLISKLLELPVIGFFLQAFLFGEDETSPPPPGASGTFTTPDYGAEAIYPTTLETFPYVNILDQALKCGRIGIMKEQIQGTIRKTLDKMKGLDWTTVKEIGILIPQIQEILPAMATLVEEGVMIDSQVRGLEKEILNSTPIPVIGSLKLTTEVLIFRHWAGIGDGRYAKGLYWQQASAVYEERMALAPPGQGTKRVYFEEENLGIVRDNFITYTHHKGKTYSTFQVIYRISDNADFQEARRNHGLPVHSDAVVAHIKNALILKPDRSNIDTAELAQQDTSLINHIKNQQGAILILPLNPTITARYKPSQAPTWSNRWIELPTFLIPTRTGFTGVSAKRKSFWCLWDLLNPNNAQIHTHYPGDIEGFSTKTIRGQYLLFAEFYSCIAGVPRGILCDEGPLFQTEAVKEVKRKYQNQLFIAAPPTLQELNPFIQGVLLSMKQRLDVVMKTKWNLFILKPQQNDEMPPKPDEPQLGGLRLVEFECREGHIDPLMGLTTLALTGTQLVNTPAGPVGVTMQLEPTHVKYRHVGLLNQYYGLRRTTRGFGENKLYRLTWSFWTARKNSARDRTWRYGLDDVTRDDLNTLIYFCAVLGVGRICPVPLQSDQEIDRGKTVRSLSIDEKIWSTYKEWGKLSFIYNGKDQTGRWGNPGGWPAIFENLDRTLGNSWQYGSRGGNTYKGGYYSRFYVFDRFVRQKFPSQIILETSYIQMLTGRARDQLTDRLKDYAKNLFFTIKQRVRQLLNPSRWKALLVAITITTAIQSILTSLGINTMDARYTSLAPLLVLIQNFAVVSLTSRALGGGLASTSSASTGSGLTSLFSSLLPLILSAIGTALFIFLTFTINTFLATLTQYGWLIGVVFSIFAIVLQYISGSVFSLGITATSLSATGLLSLVITGFGASLQALGFPFFTLADFAHLIATWILSVLSPIVRDSVVWLWYSVLLPVGKMVCNLTLAGVVKVLLNQVVGQIVRNLLGQILGVLVATVAPMLSPFQALLPL